MMRRELNIMITESESGMILRDLLKNKLGISGKLLTKVKQHECGLLLNGESVYVTAHVTVGDKVFILIEDAETYSENIVPSEGELDIRYEDSDILILNKPPNVAVHPSPGNYDSSLANRVIHYFSERGERFTFRPINRLDKGVSGLMAVAKNAYTHNFAAKQLHSGGFIREYIAIAEGRISQDFGVINAPIRRKAGSVLMREAAEEGDPALTRYWVIDRAHDCTLVRLRLETGRTHQIRVHMAHIGHPLVGDFLYGREEPERIDRCALHSCFLSMTLPFGGGKIEFQSQMPKDMQKLLNGNGEIL